jgi:hypothetical protein
MKISWPCKDSEHQIIELSYPFGEVGFICILVFQLIMDVRNCWLKIIFWGYGTMRFVPVYQTAQCHTSEDSYLHCLCTDRWSLIFTLYNFLVWKNHITHIKTRVDSKLCILSTQKNFSGLNWCDESWTWPILSYEAEACTLTWYETNELKAFERREHKKMWWSNQRRRRKLENNNK